MRGRGKVRRPVAVARVVLAVRVDQSRDLHHAGLVVREELLGPRERLLHHARGLQGTHAMCGWRSVQRESLRAKAGERQLKPKASSRDMRATQRVNVEKPSAARETHLGAERPARQTEPPPCSKKVCCARV